MENNEIVEFHLSLPCQDIIETIKFYRDELGFDVGRQAYNWVDINFFGNQITFYQNPNSKIISGNYMLDDQLLPIFHIGVILDRKNWNIQLGKYLKKQFLEIEPTIFLKNKIGEHDSFFVKDPNNYCLEFKSFKDATEIFQKQHIEA